MAAKSVEKLHRPEAVLVRRRLNTRPQHNPTGGDLLQATPSQPDPKSGGFLVLPRQKRDNPGMQRIVTLSERKASELARREAAVDALLPILTAYARAHDGRYLLFGSAARGTMKFDSDVDLLLDFPSDAMTEAWAFAEKACWDLGLEPDILPRGGCKPPFLRHIEPDIRVLA